MDLGQVSVHRLKDLDRNYLSVIICNYLRLTVILSVSQSVCKHSYGRNFDSILMKFCTVIWGPKSKIEIVWDKILITPSPILPLILKKLHYGSWRLQNGITRSL